METIPGNMSDSGHHGGVLVQEQKKHEGAGSLGQIGMGTGIGGVCRGLAEEVMLELGRNHVLGNKVEESVQARERTVCQGTPFNVLNETCPFAIFIKQ